MSTKNIKTHLSDHDKWLRKMGLSLEQIKKRKTSNPSWIKEYSESLKVDRSSAQYQSLGSFGDSSSCANRSIMANLHKEPEHIREQIIAKSKRVMPLYNKGGLQVLTDSDDLKSLNKVPNQ